MSKPNTILVCPVVPLRHMPPAEVDVIRRFLFQNIRGMDEQNDKRWRRLWGQVWQAEAGEGFQILSMERRGGPYHRMHRVVLERIFQAQEAFASIDRLHDFLKVGAGFVTWEPGKDHKPVAIPRSTAFDKCSEDELREFHAAMEDFLRTDRAQRRLWRRMKASARAEMVETLLKQQQEEA
jgi:hypothetical protein